MNINQIILTGLLLVLLILVIIKISIERTKDKIYDNNKCRNIIIDELLSEISRIPQDVYSVNYRIYIGSINVKLNSKLDRRVFLYYENNKEYIDNTVKKIVVNRNV